MNLQMDRIAAMCSALKLYRIASDWSPIAQEVARQELSFGDFLERLLGAEADARGERQRHTLLKLATLPTIKTLEQFDFERLPQLNRAQVHDLATSATCTRRRPC